MANMNDPANWQDRSNLIEYLASQLLRGRLGLVLGAGTSQFYGLPGWTKLVNELGAAVSEPPMAPGDDPIIRAEAIRLRHYKKRPTEFRDAVHALLKRGASVDFDKLRANATLAAIASLVMASRRGSASKLVTFNYDDLLELYLEYHGYVTSSVVTDRHWAGNYDVAVYHPHGFLPMGTGKDPSKSIVIGASDYLKIMQPDAANLWRPLLETYLRTHTTLHIGLSGYDKHLQSLLEPLSRQHAINDERIAYHGIHFVVPGHDRDIAEVMKDWKVFTFEQPSHDHLAPFLFEICQRASRMRIATDRI